MAYKSTETHVYNTDEILGRGFTGVVYTGIEKLSGKVHALKVVDARFRTLVQREVQTLARLEHPNIVRVFRQEREVDTSKPVVVVELCDCGNLLDLLYQPQNGYGLDEQEYLHFFHDLVSAMKYMRENNLLHRDIKPSNILVSKDENGKNVYKLSDFAEAILVSESETFRGVAGTDAYLHPALFKEAYLDQEKRVTDYDASADLWSIGVTLYQVATGEVPFRPFQGRFDREKMYEIISTKPSNVVCGHQPSENGPIVWKNELPPTCQLSRNLKNTVVKLVKDLCNYRNPKQFTFKDLFKVADDLFQCQHVYYGIPGYRVNSMYLNEVENIPELLQCVISPSSEVDFLYDGRFLTSGKMSSFLDCPMTKFSQPIVVVPHCDEIESQEDELSFEFVTKYAQQSGLRSFSKDPERPVTERDASAAKSILYVIALIQRHINEASITLGFLDQIIISLSDHILHRLSKCEQLLQNVQMFCDNYISASRSKHNQYITTFQQYKYHPGLSYSGKNTVEEDLANDEKCIFSLLQQCSTYLKRQENSLSKDYTRTKLRSINIYRLESCLKKTEALMPHFKTFRDKVVLNQTEKTMHKHHRSMVMECHKESLAVLKEVNKIYQKEMRRWQKTQRTSRETLNTLDTLEKSLQDSLKELSLGKSPSELQFSFTTPVLASDLARSDEYLSCHSIDDEEPVSYPTKEEEFHSSESIKADKTPKVKHLDTDMEHDKADKTLKVKHLDTSTETSKTDKTPKVKHLDTDLVYTKADKTPKVKYLDTSTETSKTDKTPKVKHLDTNKETPKTDKTPKVKHLDTSTETSKSDKTPKVKHLDTNKETPKTDKTSKMRNYTDVESTKADKTPKKKHLDLDTEFADETGDDSTEYETEKKENRESTASNKTSKQVVESTVRRKSRTEAELRKAPVTKSVSQPLSKHDHDQLPPSSASSKESALYKPTYNGVSQETVV